MQVSEYLENHRDLIIKNLKEFSSNIRVHDKYVWMATYHNTFCELYGFEYKIRDNDISRKISPVNLE